MGLCVAASFTAILLSGDRPADALAQISPGKRKALLPLLGRSMILYVLDTLLQARHIANIVIVANNVADIENSDTVQRFIAGSADKARISFREGAGSPATSVLKAMEELEVSGPVLVTTADNPLLSAATLDIFCEGILHGDPADAIVGLARESDIRPAFPHVRRTFIRLGKEGYSGCNLFALSAGAGQKAARAWSEVEGRRKKAWQLIIHFGVFTLLRAMIGFLDLNGAMAAASRSMGLKARAIILDDPLAAMDVDRMDHIPVAEAILAARRSGLSLSSS